MFNVLRKIFSVTVGYATDHSGLTAEDIKKIRMTNVACLVQTTNLAFLISTVLIFGIYGFIPMLGLEFIGLILCIHLQKKRYYTAAKTCLIVPTMFVVAIAVAGFEARFQVIVFGFPLIMALFLLYGQKEKTILYTLTIASVCSLVLGSYVSTVRAPFYDPGQITQAKYFSTIVTCQALFLSVLIVKGLFDESYRAEQNAAQHTTTIIKLQSEALHYQHQMELQIKVMHEMEIRTAMAARTAHHINNPLNAVLGLRSIVDNSSCLIRSIIEQMLPKAGERSPEAMAVIHLLETNFDSIEKSTKSMEHSLARATHVVKELQQISGVSGCNWERVQIRKVWNAVKEQFSIDESLIAKKISWTESAEVLDLESFGHSTLLPGAIFYLLREMVEEFPPSQTIRIALEVDMQKGDNLCLKVTFQDTNQVLQSKDWREFTLSNHIASSFGAKLSVIASMGFCHGIQIELDRTGAEQSKKSSPATNDGSSPQGANFSSLISD